MTFTQTLSDAASTPSTPRGSAEAVDSLVMRHASVVDKINTLEVTVDAAATGMLEYALLDPVPLEINQAAKEVDERLLVCDQLEKELYLIADEQSQLLLSTSDIVINSKLVLLGNNLSESAMRLRQLQPRHTAAIRRLLAARVPDFLTAVRERLPRFSSVVGAAFAVFGLAYTVVFYLFFDIPVLNYVTSLTDFLLVGVAHATIVVIIIAIAAFFFWLRAEYARRVAMSIESTMVKVAETVRSIDLRRRQPLRVLPPLASVVIASLFGIAFVDARLRTNPSELSTIHTRSGSALVDSKVLGTVANYAFVFRRDSSATGLLPSELGTSVVLRADEVRCVAPQVVLGGRPTPPESCRGQLAESAATPPFIVRVVGESATSWRWFAREKLACEPADDIDWDRQISDEMIMSSPLFVDHRWNELDSQANRKYSIAIEGCEPGWPFGCMRASMRERLSKMITTGGERIRSVAIAGSASSTGPPERNLRLSHFRAAALACLIADQVPDGERDRCTDAGYVSRLVFADEESLTFTPDSGGKPVVMHLHALGERQPIPAYVGADGDASERRVIAIACRARTSPAAHVMTARTNHPAAPLVVQEGVAVAELSPRR